MDRCRDKIQDEFFWSEGRNAEVNPFPDFYGLFGSQ